MTRTPCLGLCISIYIYIYINIALSLSLYIYIYIYIMKIITLILITIISSIAISVLVLLSNYGKHSTLLYDIILHDTIYIYIYASGICIGYESGYASSDHPFRRTRRGGFWRMPTSWRYRLLTHRQLVTTIVVVVAPVEHLRSRTRLTDRPGRQPPARPPARLPEAGRGLFKWN